MDKQSKALTDAMVAAINDQSKLDRHILGEQLVNAILEEADKIHEVFPKLQTVIAAYNVARNHETPDNIKALVATLNDIEADPDPSSDRYAVDATIIHHAILGLLTLISEYKRQPMRYAEMNNSLAHLKLRVCTAIANAILTSLIQKYKNVIVADAIIVDDKEEQFAQDL